MRWWDDLWLNESFAEWAAYHTSVQATRFTDAWTSFQNQRKAWAYRQDQLPSTHPIAADMVDLEAVEVNFDGITYAKGAAALRQLVAWVGEEGFFAGLRTYFADHAWGNTSLGDLLAHLEKASGRDLSGWSREWLQTSGVNLLRPLVEIAPDGTLARVAVVQEPPAEPPGVAPVLRSHRIAVGLYERTAAGLVRTRRVESDVVGPLTELPELVGAPAPDLLLLNDDDLTFAKVRLDERSLATAVTSISDLASPLARALVWGATWDMTRDAEMSTGDFLALVLSGVERESDVGVLAQLLRQVRTACELYAAPEHREDYLSRLGDTCVALARGAEPGSDRQLVFVRAASAVARTEGQRALVAGLLDGTESLEGLAVDTDLRWTLLQRLVAVGERGEQAIDDELARDDTATGRRQAAYTRAAIPTAEAKEAAWAAAVDGDDLPNALLLATVTGFVQADQRELQRSFVERYFAAVAPSWDQRTNETAQTIVMGLYPTYLADASLVARTDEFLDSSPDLPSGARRLVLEARDGVSRALRCQARDT
jgi:aminopeptidase N